MSEDRQLLLDQVRLVLGNKTNTRGHRVFTEESQRQAIAYASARLKAGATSKQTAEELGLHRVTLRRWLRRKGPKAAVPPAPQTRTGFKKLEVKTAPHAQRLPVLHGPCGVWVEGLGIEGIAAVLRSLTCLA